MSSAGTCQQAELQFHHPPVIPNCPFLPPFDIILFIFFSKNYRKSLSAWVCLERPKILRWQMSCSRIQPLLIPNSVILVHVLVANCTIQVDLRWATGNVHQKLLGFAINTFILSQRWSCLSFQLAWQIYEAQWYTQSIKQQASLGACFIHESPGLLTLQQE